MHVWPLQVEGRDGRLEWSCVFCLNFNVFLLVFLALDVYVPVFPDPGVSDEGIAVASRHRYLESEVGHFSHYGFH